MKIRMKDNSLRLHLTQTEVDGLGSEGKVSSTTRIGWRPEQTFSYSLVKNPGTGAVTVSFEGNEITVNVPEQTAGEWAFTNQIDFEEFMPLEAGPKLFILVEEDSRCLQERPYEDESDAFSNPLEDKHY